MIVTEVSSIFNGRDRAYIYIILSKAYRAIYVGETNDRRGTIGRFRAHIGSSGTFRKRFEERIGEDIEQIDDLILLSYLLPTDQLFTGVASTHRQSVEYLVQVKLIEMRAGLIKPFKVVSEVRTFSTTSEKRVEKLAEAIVLDFISYYKI
ncbi:hypothetical protein [Paenibacillus sp. MMS18-CY102]|uniref:hypothetical protein n=1 Tax=Paenibacillus sp. MMS18-CY102 TaxID=2682849 RepID=UPI00136654C9|nr:hypothetical protein [Paenibacillus sp. MMS18-CY102]MWC31079.1 hypothetical protein [Paenibacillus sp. MMS18-CY102]